ncbi:MAG: hypothetical protein K9H64_00745 [Bacteroidales bacterium]|nr:hypothetical protein [Bacteroidales bacterium]MCF8457567.1 hypothetical protein [Bacteroidales bacterium]
MQNTQSLHNILKQLSKLQESINKMDNSRPIAALEIDLALEKLRGIYDLVLNIKGNKPKEESHDQQESEYLNSFDVEDIIDEQYGEEPDFEMEENVKEVVKDEIIPEPKIVEKQEPTKEPPEKIEKPLPHPVEIEESPISFDTHVELQKEPTRQEEVISVEESTLVREKPIQQIKDLRKVETQIKDKTPSKLETEKKTYPKENSGRVIGDQLGADKKSLYDLISGNKADKDIVSQFKKQPVTDINKAVSLNDKIWFTKELFNNDGALYKKYVDQLNQSTDLEEGLNIITSNFDWDSESRVVQKFLSIVSRRFI